MAGVQEPLVYTPTAHVGQLGATTGGILTLAALLKLTLSQPKSGISDALEALIIVSIILSAFLMTLQAVITKLSRTDIDGKQAWINVVITVLTTLLAILNAVIVGLSTAK